MSERERVCMQRESARELRESMPALLSKLLELPESGRGRESERACIENSKNSCWAFAEPFDYLLLSFKVYATQGRTQTNLVSTRVSELSHAQNLSKNGVKADSYEGLSLNESEQDLTLSLSLSYLISHSAITYESSRHKLSVIISCYSYLILHGK